ncbi:MAG: alpha-D-ribose 1-methylphosphonate 5-triphosphate diphosphatase [Pseudomonadota bacterium]
MDVDLVGARVLRGGALDTGPLHISGGVIADAPVGRAVDLSGFTILPGIIDLHGDGFERHVAPRRGAMTDLAEGLRAAEAELAANGITTGFLAQFFSWEGGLRGPDFGARVMAALRDVAGQVVTDLRGQVRMEVHLLEEYATLPERLAEWGCGYVVFNDHLPHDRLAEGRRPPRLTGQALKAGRNPDDHFAMLLDLHARRAEVPRALDALCARLAGQGVRMGSHDDSGSRAAWLARGVDIAEFPETLETAETAGGPVILGAPNLVRGGSHKGNVSALDVVSVGACDALASDYHYPSPRRGALGLVRAGVLDLPSAWALLSSGPARVMGLEDRGDLVPGLRADLVVLDGADRVALTMAGGRVSYMNGDIGARFL